MIYNAIWHEGSLRDLKKLDQAIAKKIVEKVKKHLIKSPLELGIPLKGNFKGLYRYRFGDYRIIYALDRKENNIIVLSINHHL